MRASMIATSAQIDAVDDDFNKSTQILLRHGFVVKGLSPPDDDLGINSNATPRQTDSQKSRSLSPVGPNSRGIEVGDPIGMGRARSDGFIPSRRVTWDLSCAATGFPALPFTKNHQQQLQRESSSGARRTSKKFQRRSTVAAIDMAENIVQHQPPRQYHSSTHHDNDIEALRQILRKSSSRERHVRDSSLRRRSSATTFGMSEKLDELLHQPKDDEQVLVQQSNGNGDHPQHYTGYREDYFLGDVVKSVCHMVIEPTPKSALQAVESLQLHNFAWVKRSDGLYTYAILAYRSSCPLVESASSSEKKEVEEEYMYFVVDDIGSTKMVPKSRWHVNVRRIHEDSE